MKGPDTREEEEEASPTTAAVCPCTLRPSRCFEKTAAVETRSGGAVTISFTTVASKHVYIVTATADRSWKVYQHQQQKGSWPSRRALERPPVARAGTAGRDGMLASTRSHRHVVSAARAR